MTYPATLRARPLFGCFAVVAITVYALAIAPGVAVADSREHSAHSAAIGKPGVATQAKREVRIEMNDTMRFVPARIDVKRGETVRFTIVNTGRLDHEFVLGTAKSLREHAEHMKQSPGMKHKSAHHVAVAPGKTSELVWQFTRPGTVDFACLVPGHYEAGMKGQVAVK